MMRSRLNSMFGELAIALCPLAVMIGIRTWMHAGGPATASAAPERAVSIVGLQNDHPPQPTAAEQAVLARVKELAALKPVDPFERAHVEFVVPQIPAPPPIKPAQTPTAIPPPQLVVSSIVAGRQPMAIVNGKAMRVGDEVAPGWVIQYIKPSAVVIHNADGRSMTFSIDHHHP